MSIALCRRKSGRYSPVIAICSGCSSLDEAYLDVTQDKQQIGSAIRIAQLIRAAIREKTGLTASAGVSYDKFLAKVASDQNKPDGMFVVQPHEGAEFVVSLPVRRFYGVEGARISG